MSETSLPFEGKTALVTGASSGMGAAFSKAFARAGASVHMVGRNRSKLQSVADAIGPNADGLLPKLHVFDFAAEDFSQQLASDSQIGALAVDLLVHCAGEYRADNVLSVRGKDLEHLFRVNVAAPFELTQCLLPALSSRCGQIAFINSSVARLPANAVPGAYSISKHAASALADSLRSALNDQGVRVLSVFPGRTNTPMQEAVFTSENKPYPGDRLLQSADIVDAVINALGLPMTAELTHLDIRPMNKT